MSGDERLAQLILDGDWTARIRVGDVLRARTGQLRVVRHVHHAIVKWSGPIHLRTSVTFKINRCAWTRRCYTVYTSSDLRTMGYQPTRARVELHTKMDRAILRDITSGDRPMLTCCDVESVPA